MYLSRFLKDYGGKRCVFNEERNEGKVGQDRSGSGREFQMDGAANEKEKEIVNERVPMKRGVFQNFHLRLKVDFSSQISIIIRRVKFSFELEFDIRFVD